MDPIKQACFILKLVLRARAPYDTGNLAINSIRIVENAVVIGGTDVANYAIYTNEPWINRPGKNPNEGWVQRAIMEAAPLIQKALNKKITKEDLKIVKGYYRFIIERRRAEMKRRLKKMREKIQGASA